MYKIILKFPFNNTIEKTSLIQYNKVSGRYLYEGKILIIEDDFTIQTQLKTLLSGNGYEVFAVTDFPKQ